MLFILKTGGCLFGRKLIIDRVMPGDSHAFDAWDNMLREVFADPDDLDTKEDLLKALSEVDKNKFYLFRDEDHRPAGFELVQIDARMPGVKVGYVPWAGMVEGQRNNGQYPALAKRVMDICRAEGIAVLLQEIEDPKRIHKRQLGCGETVEGVVSFAKRCCNFWRRAPMNALIIDDGYSASKRSLTAYMRPASSDSQIVQDYDLMALRVLDPTHPMLVGMFNADRTAITLDAYKRFYLQMTQIQYGVVVPEGLGAEDYYAYLEAKLRQNFPAVEIFCGGVDKAMGQGRRWVAIEQGPIKAKSRPVPVHNVVLGANIKPLGGFKQRVYQFNNKEDAALRFEDVVIIGAGVAGLSAAVGLIDEAKAQGRAVPSIRVLEARERLGGRLHTVIHEGRAVNMGAHWMHGGVNNQFWAWASKRYPDMTREYTYDTTENGYVVTENGVRHQTYRDGCMEALKRAWDEHLDVSYEADISLAELEERYVNTADTRSYIQFVANCWMGTDSAEHISCHEFFGDPNPSGGIQLKGGNQQLVERMAQEAELEGVVIDTDCEVVRVEAHSRGYIICNKDGSCIGARHVGIAVPLSVLKTGKIVFDPPLGPVKDRQIKGIGQAYMTKVFVPVAEAFFKERDIKPDTRISLMVEGEPPLFLHLYTNGTPGVTVFSGGAVAREVEAYDEVQIQAFLKRAFEKSLILQGVESSIEGAALRTGWNSDALSGGAYTAALPGSIREGGLLVRNKLFANKKLGGSCIVFMGEGMCFVEDGPGGMSSAHLSGLRAARNITALMGTSVVRYDKARMDSHVYEDVL